ncbi:MAG: flagellar basal body-associated FliL family protein [bacterium]
MESSIQESEIPGVPDVVGSSKRPIMIVIAVGLLIGAVVGVFGAGPAVVARFGPKAVDTTLVKSEHGKEAGKAGGEKILRVVDNLVLNPAGSGGTRFLMVTATLEVKDAAADEALKARDVEVRDALIGYFGRKTVDELTDMGGRDNIKKDLLALLRPLFPAGSIKAVYFPQFVIQ